MRQKIKDLFASRLEVANLGLEVFAEACTAQEIPCVHVKWKPTAGGDQKLIDLLAKLKNL